MTYGYSSALYDHDNEDGEKNSSSPIKQPSLNHHKNDSKSDTASSTGTVGSRSSSASRRKSKFMARVKSMVHVVSISRTWIIQLLSILTS